MREQLLLLFLVLFFYSGSVFVVRGQITVDHNYYELALFQHNENGMYDSHYVDLSNGVGHVHEFLSNHSQAAEAVAPGFDFPFYGHLVDRFFVTTHGFLSFAPRLHNLMYKTQYIAPLRVKLDPSASEEATVDYLSLPDRLTVQWTNVSVQEPFQHPHGGNFTFQVTLYSNGDIVFVYVKIPELLTSDALYDGEPVAGISDAFLVGDNELHVYHTANIEPRHINSQTVAIFKAKPTCVQQLNCGDCMALRSKSEFKCAWCGRIRRCSDGADRLREHWDVNSCPTKNATSVDQCSSSGNDEAPPAVVPPSKKGATAANYPISPLSSPSSSSSSSSSSVDSGLSAGVIVSIVVSVILLVVLVGLGLAFVFVYGRNNPGGLAERIAMRLEANYKRFDGGADRLEESPVEMCRTPSPTSSANQQSEEGKIGRNNNNSISVSF